MNRNKFVRLTAWVLLVAFSVMTIGKSYHHHEVVLHEDKVCPLDGMLMSEHHENHAVLGVEVGYNDNDCLLCHFTITKVVNPEFDYHVFALPVCSIGPVTAIPALCQACPAYHPLRAPPYFV